MYKKEKQTVPFEDELNEAVHKKRWVPLGGVTVAVILILTIITVIVGSPFLPSMISDPFLSGKELPKLEIYDSPEEDPRRIAWVGNTNFTTIIRRFVIDLQMPVQHTVYGNCSSLLFNMRNEGYYAHLYVLAEYTMSNQIVGRDGIIYDANLLMTYSGADCGALIREIEPQAKILCLVEYIDSFDAKDCISEGFFVMVPEEAVSQDALSTDIKMTIAEGTIRDLIELPFDPDADLNFPNRLPDDW